ncbi:MAG: hypothetical protein ABIJ30_13325 [bacterium]
MARANKFTITIFIILALALGIGSYFKYYVDLIRIGTIVEIRKDAIVVQGAGPHDPAYILYLAKNSRFYNSKGGEIILSEFKVGERVRVKLFPRSYRGILLARKQKVVRWVKVFSEK